MCNNEKALDNSYAYSKYTKAYNRAISMMEQFYNESHSFKDFQNTFVKKYTENNLDPDGQAQVFSYGIICTADGLHSIRRICSFEKNIEDVINTYKEYRKLPIFFFPRENGGINTSRYSILGDRIDHTLYDLKMYYTNNKENCKLKCAFSKPNTSLWLEKMNSFENIIDWLDIKGIFTDNDYNVYDLEYSKSITIKHYKDYYSTQWTTAFYENLKEKILEFCARN